VFEGDGQYPLNIGLEVFGTGSGRVVYDISDYATVPAVLKVAYNDSGHHENINERTDRDTWAEPLRERLVPVTDSFSDGLAVVQPMVETPLEWGCVQEAKDELSGIVEQAGGHPREVQRQNIGRFQDTFVLLDHGDI
jgi:hypothetical protein